MPKPKRSSPIKAVAVGPNKTIAVTDGKRVRRSEPPDQQWEELDELFPITPSITVKAVAVGQNGTIVVGDSTGGVYRWTGSKWEDLDMLKPERSSSIRAMAIGQDGTIIVGESAGGVYRWMGNWWEQLAVPSEFAAAQSIAIGPNDTFVTLSRRGVVHKWVPIAPALLSLLPMVAFVIVLSFSMLTFVQARRRERAEPKESESNSIDLRSDAPIKDSNQAIGTAAKVATQLSNFMSHPDASAPLTFALTGNWGSGKSSIMNLVQQKLREDRCPCVWFNAWHHQNETHLFAALMECIRLQAVLRFFFTFYLTLVQLRVRKHPMQVGLPGLFVLAFPIAIGWLLFVFIQGDGILVASNLIPVADILAVWFGWKTRLNPFNPFGDTPTSLIRASGA